MGAYACAPKIAWKVSHERSRRPKPRVTDGGPCATTHVGLAELNRFQLDGRLIRRPASFFFEHYYLFVATIIAIHVPGINKIMISLKR